MPDAYANSTALLEQLLRQVMKETDPVKYDRLAAEIRQVLEEREHLRTAIDLQERLDHEKKRRLSA